MRPSIYGDAVNIARWIEARAAEHSSELITNIPFKHGERCSHELSAPGAGLLARRQSRFARSAQHEQNDGLVGFTGKFVLAKAHRKIERGISMVAGRRNDLMDAKVLKRCPVTDSDVGVNQRSLHQGMKRVLLLLAAVPGRDKESSCCNKPEHSALA